MSKPKVAFFDFTSCEGCQLNKLNLENDLLSILELVDIVEFREAMDDKADEYDIAFIEGSISTPTCIERIHDIRRRTKILVALGACAVNGGINAMKKTCIRLTGLKRRFTERINTCFRQYLFSL